MKKDTPENFLRTSTFLGKTVMTKNKITISLGRNGTSLYYLSTVNQSDIFFRVSIGVVTIKAVKNVLFIVTSKDTIDMLDYIKSTTS